MIEEVRLYNKEQKPSSTSSKKEQVTVSLEVETPRSKAYLLELLQKGDVVSTSSSIVLFELFLGVKFTFSDKISFVI